MARFGHADGWKRDPAVIISQETVPAKVRKGALATLASVGELTVKVKVWECTNNKAEFGGFGICKVITNTDTILYRKNTVLTVMCADLTWRKR